MEQVGTAAKSDSSLATLGWAAYLACSWTWCIGMFLPVLLVRDYGAMGWVVFAIPNVIGAAAMGWMLSSVDQSRRLVREHRVACALFSIVTLLFHGYWIGWMFSRFGAAPWAAPIIVLAVTTMLWGLAQLNVRAERVLAALLWVGSAGAMAWVLWYRQSLGALWPQEAPLQPVADLIWLAPVCAFGFALCPYLDLTFHHARQNATTPAQARRAFGLGFGVLFLVMIVFTFFYADLLVQPMVVTALAAVLLWHMTLQTGFTAAVHLRQLSRVTPRSVIGITVVLGLALAGIGNIPYRYDGIEVEEVIYRCFMSAYGLAFPAYVWICMIPRRATGEPVSARQWAVMLLAVLLAAPMFWIGFIEQRMIWLAPGLAVVLLARLLVPAKSRTQAVAA